MDVYGLVLLQMLLFLVAGVLAVRSPDLHQLLVGPGLGGAAIFWIETAGGAVATLGGLHAFRATYPLNAVLTLALTAFTAAPLAAACALWRDEESPALGGAGALLLIVLLTCSTLAALVDRAASQQPSRLAPLFCVLLCYDLENARLQVLILLAVAFQFLVERPALHRALAPPSKEHLVYWAYMSLYSLVLALLVGIKRHMPFTDVAFCWAVSGAFTLCVVTSAHSASRQLGRDGRLADALRVYAF